MKLALFSATFAVGLFLALHLAMNASVGHIVANPRMGNAIFWTIGAIVAIMIGLSGWESTFWQDVRKIPMWLWSAGAIGACLVFAIAVFIPKLGASTTNILLLSGQVLGGMIIAHYGLLSSPVEKINAVRLIGVAVMILGASISVMGKIPFFQ